MLIKRAAPGNLKASFHCTHWHRFFPLKKAFFESLRLPLAKGSSTSNQAFPLRRKDVNRPTRCSEPLRSKVGGPSNVYAILCGMGPHGALAITEYRSFFSSYKDLNIANEAIHFLVLTIFDPFP